MQQIINSRSDTTVNDFNTDFNNIQSGIVFLYNGKSTYLSLIVHVLKYFHTIPLLILDIAHPKAPDYLTKQGIVSHGRGETYWISDGQIIAENDDRTPDENTIITYSDNLITRRMHGVIAALSDFLGDLSWYEFFVHSYDGSTLILQAGLSLSYPEVEITFHQVSFCQLKSHWNKGIHLPFTILHGEEAAPLNQLYGIEIGHILIRIQHEDMLPDHSNAWLVAVQKLEWKKLHAYAPEI